MSAPVTIDVIILSFAKNDELKHLTEQSIETLLESENPEEVKFNIVVIESNKQLRPFAYAGANTIYPKAGFGFNRYLNIGLSSTTAAYVCFSNNDVIFSKHWASEILNAMKIDHTLLSASPICPVFHPKHGFEVNTGNHYGRRAGREVAGWFIFLKRELMHIIGPLDEKITFWYADNDYADLLQKFNINHALVSTSVVKHLVESTRLSLDYVKQHKITDGNFIYYDYKWNHRNYALYRWRKLRFNIYNKLRLLKFRLKSIKR